MKKFLLLLAFLGPALAGAQTLPEFSEFAVGDRLSYQTRVGDRTGRYEFVFSEATPTKVRGTVSINGQHMEFEAPGHGYLGKEFCLADVMECEWSPPVKMFDKAAKPGESWVITTQVAMKNKTIVDEALESRVEKFEKIRVPAGEFDAVRVDTRGSIKAKAPNGRIFNGALKMTTWYGVANKRLVLLKREYENTFKQTFAQELLSLPELAK